MFIPFKKMLYNCALILLSLSVGYLLCEGINYFFVTNTVEYQVWSPGLHRSSHINETILPGVFGMSEFNINEHGYRGTVFTSNKSAEFRILVLGGSTTENLYLNDTEAWPYLLERNLERTIDGQKVVVMNVGKSGRSSLDHIIQLKHLTEQYSPDLAIVLMGVNDLLIDLSQPPPRFSNYGKAFEQSPKYSLSTTLAYKFVREMYVCFVLKGCQDEAGGLYVKKRSERQQAVPIKSVPSVEASLGQYYNNTARLIEVAELTNLTLVLLTQPSIWKDDMPEEEELFLWLNYDKDGNFYDASVMNTLMQRYNEQMISACQNSTAFCFDLAVRIHKSLASFYDDVHFNENGSRTVAYEVADFLKTSHPSFLTLTPSLADD